MSMAEFIVYDLISLHNSTPEETKKTVKEYCPGISDEKIDILIKEELKKKESCM
jgi:hypothetical protein